MASISVTYTFANSTTADATQVNQNFTDIINGTSDGTKDFNINALTAAGTATLNGNIVLGNGSAKTITPNGSFAGTILLSTTYTYDIGSNTFGLRALYFGDAGSNARSTKVQGATIGSAWTLTLPTGAGTSSQKMITDGGGVSSWAYEVTSVVSKTANYTLTASDDMVLGSSSGGAFTLTLPTAASVTGKVYRMKKTDSSTNAITINTTSSQTIDGATSKLLDFQYKSLSVMSDGSNWVILTARDNFASMLYAGNINDNSSTSNGLSNSSTTYADFTDVGTPVVSQDYSKNFPTVTKATGAAITFTPTVTGTIRVIASSIAPYVGSGNGSFALTDGSNNIMAQASWREQTNLQTTPFTLASYLDVTAGSAVTLKIRAKSSGPVAVTMGQSTSPEPQTLVSFAIEYVA